jgi:hypothetical protein
MIRAHAAPTGYFKKCCLRSGRFEDANHQYFLQRITKNGGGPKALPACRRALALGFALGAGLPIPGQELVDLAGWVVRQLFEHVHIRAGGQAVVGLVGTPGGVTGCVNPRENGGLNRKHRWADLRAQYISEPDCVR